MLPTSRAIAAGAGAERRDHRRQRLGRAHDAATGLGLSQTTHRGHHARARGRPGHALHSLTAEIAPRVRIVVASIDQPRGRR